jgi:predicted DNA-binding protein
MSRNSPSSFRIPDLTKEQIAELSERLGMSQAQIIILAVDRLYQREFPQSDRSHSE